MHVPSIDVAILTEDRYVTPDRNDWYQAQIAREEDLVADALAALGLRVGRRSWADPDMDWSQCRCALFRSTWDYFDRYAEFSSWLDRVAGQTRLFNAAELIRWNVDKRYLGDLQDKGVSIVPTRFVARGEVVSLADIMDAQGWDEVVFKPVVSGAARLTHRVGRATLSAHEAVFARCAADENMMVQAFEPAILSTGEVSVIVIGGRTTHAIRKTPRAGDFRVQDDHGGTVHAHAPAEDERWFAEAAVAACPVAPAYARVDFVRSADGVLRLMELELVEPELFFRFHPPAAAELAHVLAEKLR
ncbi:ATP-grasp domain-containing protein [Thauera sp. AutoDN2]|uniref:ATP-grasp domain-containing protein n=1 Tax=Thauera sp. AutoDN2 TaxID=3416051 RepID=UPI003F4C9BFF